MRAAASHSCTGRCGKLRQRRHPAHWEQGDVFYSGRAVVSKRSFQYFAGKHPRILHRHEKHGSCAMRNFAGISFLEKQAQDAPGLLKFLHLLDDHHPGEAVFSGIQERFRRAGFMMRAALARMPVMTHSMLSPRDKKGKCARKKHRTMVPWREGACRSGY